MERHEDLDLETLRDRLRRVPIFPLPSTVLIPGGHLPLHVFEPRYRAMVRDCLAGDRLMAVGLLAGEEEDPRPPIHPVSGLGLISAHAELPDGRFFILLEGLIRARIVKELRTSEPYRQVRVVPIPDDDPHDGAALALSGQILQRLVLDLARHLPEDTGQPLVKACLRERNPGRLADVIGAAVLVDHEQRQRFLEESDPERRLDLMTMAVSAVLTRIGDVRGERSPN